MSNQAYEGSPDSSKITAPIPCGSPFRLELGSFNWNKPLKKEGIYEILIYDSGTEQNAEYQYRALLKKGEIHGVSADSWRAWIYDRDLQPSAVRWHLSDGRGTTDLLVSFAPDGLVDSYTVQFSPAGGQKKEWTVSADGTLLEYVRGRTTVPDLTTVRDSEWQRIWFY